MRNGPLQKWSLSILAEVLAVACKLTVHIQYRNNCVQVVLDVCVNESHNAVEIGVPQQHGAVVARRRVQVKNQRVCAVLLPADVRDMVANHLFLCG